MKLSFNHWNKWLKWAYLTSIHLLALFALFMIAVAVAAKLKLTNTAGNVDVNNRYFAQMAGKYNQGFKVDSLTLQKTERKVYQNIGLLSEQYPYNAKVISEAYEKSGDLTIAQRMLDAANLKMLSNKYYTQKLKEIQSNEDDNALSIYPWANYKEWKDFCKYVKNDKKAIDSVSKITGVESRLLVMCLVGEQIRMFNSFREKFKSQVYKYNHIILTRNIGYGVTGILQNTALKIEANLFNKNSPFYAGDYYQKCLNVTDSFPGLVAPDDTIEIHKNLTIQRLMKGGDHFYSYLYTAFFLRQFEAQWNKSGKSLAFRPEIIATLYNLGYQKSKPNNDPKVGGSEFKVGDYDYTFGGLCYEFYYSGELDNLFPMTSRPFIPTDELERTNKFLTKKNAKDKNTVPISAIIEGTVMKDSSTR